MAKHENSNTEQIEAEIRDAQKRLRSQQQFAEAEAAEKRAQEDARIRRLQDLADDK